MPRGASTAQQKTAAPSKRSAPKPAAKPVKAVNPASAAKPSRTTRSSSNTAHHTATVATQARKQATKGKRRRDELDDEAAEGAEVAGGGSSHDIYDAEIVWSNKRKDADQKEDGADEEVADDQHDERDHEEEAEEEYESDDATPAPKAITAKQLKTLDPIVKTTRAKIQQRLQHEQKSSKHTEQAADKQTVRAAAAASSTDKQTTKQAAQSKAKEKTVAKQQPAKMQKKAEVQHAEVDEEEQQPKSKKRTKAKVEEQAEDEQEDDEHDADGANNTTPSNFTNTHNHARRTRHSSTALPSAAELAERGVVYFGHLPHGFFEDQMRAFFSQFGEVTRVQLARNPKTGRSRHYGFVEFAHSSVASLVADAMHRYMMFGHTLVATVVPAEQRHAGLFDKDGMRFRVVPYRKIARVAHNAARSGDEQEKRVSRLVRKDGKKRKQLAELGVEYDFPGYVSHTLL